MRVPVLSKTIILILPLTLTLAGDMQKIFLFFNLEMANATPTDIDAGRAGGTVMVIRSSDLSINFGTVVPSLIIAGIEMIKPTIVKVAINPTNFIAS